MGTAKKCGRGSGCLGCMIVSFPLTALLLVGFAVALLLLFPSVLRQQVEEVYRLTDFFFCCAIDCTPFINVHVHYGIIYT